MMKKVSKQLSLGLLGIAFLGGCSVACAPFSPQVDGAQDAAVFAALTAASGEVIPQEQVHCEIVGPAIQGEDELSYPETRVGDFITHYLLWSQKQTSHSDSRLSCEGETMLQCTWQYGERKSNEGWGDYLRFIYDPSQQQIVPNSLECISVP